MTGGLGRETGVKVGRRRGRKGRIVTSSMVGEAEKTCLKRTVWSFERAWGRTDREKEKKGISEQRAMYASRTSSQSKGIIPFGGAARRRNNRGSRFHRRWKRGTETKEDLTPGVGQTRGTPNKIGNSDVRPEPQIQVKGSGEKM